MILARKATSRDQPSKLKLPGLAPVHDLDKFRLRLAPLDNVIHNRGLIALRVNHLNICVPSKTSVGTVSHRTMDSADSFWIEQPMNRLSFLCPISLSTPRWGREWSSHSPFSTFSAFIEIKVLFILLWLDFVESRG
jgi:hypothetical protein